MALIFSEGFDSYLVTNDLTDRGWDNNNTTKLTLDATGSEFGGPCIKMEDTDTPSFYDAERVVRAVNKVSAGSDTFRHFFRIKTSVGYTDTDVTNGAEFLTQARSATNGGAAVYCWGTKIGSSGGIVVIRLDNTTYNVRGISGVSSAPVNDGNWHTVEIETLTHTSAGTLKVWVDGVLDVNLTGIDTSDTSGVDSSVFTHVAMSGGSDSAAPGEIVYLDDVILWDDSGTDFIGALTNHKARIITLRPDAEGTTSDFTPQSGVDNSAMVNETVPDGDTTYVESSTTGHKDLYTYTDLPTSIDYSEIFGVNVVTVARNIDAGTIDLRALALNSATTTAGDTKSLGTTTFSDVNQFFANDPNTGTAWTEATLNTTEFGVEVI